MIDEDTWRLRAGEWTVWQASRAQFTERLRSAWKRLDGYENPEIELNPDICQAATAAREVLRRFAAQWNARDQLFQVPPDEALTLCALLKLTRGVLRYAEGPMPPPPLIVENSCHWTCPATTDHDPRRSRTEARLARDNVVRAERSRLDENGRLPAHHAAALGYSRSMMAEYVEPDIYLDVEDRFGVTPLGYALRSGQAGTVHAVLAAGADADNAGSAISHPLLETTDPVIIERLLEYDADPNAACPDTGDTLLHRLNQLPIENAMLILDLVMRAGGRLTVSNRSGQTPLDCMRDTPLLRPALKLFERPRRDDDE